MNNILSGFAQQGLYAILYYVSFHAKTGADAEECYNQIINSLRQVPGIPSASPSAGDTTKSFVEQYLMGEIQRT